MPYISTEAVREKRKEIRNAFPDFKISVRKRDDMEIAVTIMEGPDIFQEGKKGDSYYVNEFHIDRDFTGRANEVLSKIKEIAVRGQRELVYDMDYGSVPTYYVSIGIGQWDRPYVIK